MSEPGRLRIVIADDEGLVVAAVAAVVTALGHEVVGRASDGRQAVALVREKRPDVVLMDISMPELDGLEATRQLQRDAPCPVVLLTAHDDPALVERASVVGAAGYLVKPPRRGEVARSIAIARARFSEWRALREANERLEHALTEVKRLQGLLPICCHCKKIRDEDGYWTRVEAYVEAHTEATFTHSICDGCMKEHYPDDEPPPDQSGS